jgi:hypothetical protein
MKVEIALKPLPDLVSIILFEAFSTENSKGKNGRLIRLKDLKILLGRKFTSAFLSEKYNDVFVDLFIGVSKGWDVICHGWGTTVHFCNEKNCIFAKKILI